jgi:hypothetical protein
VTIVPTPVSPAPDATGPGGARGWERPALHRELTSEPSEEIPVDVNARGEYEPL